MVRSSRKSRRCVVGDQTYLWSVGHEHLADFEGPVASRYQDCSEILTLRLYGAHGRLRIVFQQGDGRLVSDGRLPSGAVGMNDLWLNLHEPGTVRALLDQAIAGGWDAADPGTARIDGWTFFDAVAALRTHAAPSEPSDAHDQPNTAPDQSNSAAGVVE
jgi:hypothetical protein